MWRRGVGAVPERAPRLRERGRAGAGTGMYSDGCAWREPGGSPGRAGTVPGESRGCSWGESGVCPRRAERDPGVCPRKTVAVPGRSPDGLYTGGAGDVPGESRECAPGEPGVYPGKAGAVPGDSRECARGEPVVCPGRAAKWQSLQGWKGPSGSPAQRRRWDPHTRARLAQRRGRTPRSPPGMETPPLPWACPCVFSHKAMSFAARSSPIPWAGKRPRAG
ncbi:uncharacterized protein [Pithys albifrons albifrons]|uniref:uncharacterized protein n=1 Tax=Pithys albifrons albifrons TaxID=3385563 RepID=UPI003A5CCA02